MEGKNIKIVKYKGTIGLLTRDPFVALHIPQSPTSTIKDISNSSLNLTDYKIEKERGRIHFCHKNPLAPLSYFRISEDGEDSILYFTSSKITDEELSKILPIKEIINIEDFNPLEIKTFRELQLLGRNYPSDDRIKDLLAVHVPMPEEDKEILKYVLELAGIKEKDIVPYTIFYSLSTDITSPGISKPLKEGDRCYRKATFPCPLHNIPIREIDKKWALGFSIGCFYKRYGEEDPDRSLSDYVLASYAQVKDLQGFDPQKRLEQEPPKHLIPTLTILSRIWDKEPKTQLELVRKIWVEDFGPSELENALSLVE